MLKHAKTLIIIVAIIILALLGYLYESRYTQITETEIKIGSLSHQSGFGAVWGTVERDAVKMRVDELESEGLKLNVVYEDCASDIPTCVTAAQKLFNVDNIDVLIGPTWTEWTEPIAPIANQLKRVMIGPSSILSKGLQPYAFSNFLNLSNANEVTMKFLKEKGVDKVTQIVLTNAYFDSVNQSQKELAPEYGITIIDEYRITNESTKDFSTILTKVKNSESDFILANLLETQMEPFAKQAIELDVNIPILYSSNVPVIPGIYQYDYVISDEFYKKYKERYGIDPSPSGQTAYDAVSLVAAAIRSGATNSDEIANFLRGVEDFPGITGEVTFNEEGYVEYTHDQYRINFSK